MPAYQRSESMLQYLRDLVAGAVLRLGVKKAHVEGDVFFLRHLLAPPSPPPLPCRWTQIDHRDPG